MGVKSPNRRKSNNCTELYIVDVTDIWRERNGQMVTSPHKGNLLETMEESEDKGQETEKP